MTKEVQLTNRSSVPVRPLKRHRPAAITVLDHRPPALRFSPTAWAKLLYLRDYGPTEVGGFAIAAKEDLLRVEDLQLVEQHCSAVSVAFDNLSVAEFFDRQVDRGLAPQQFARIWVHTHPGSSAEPSSTDEDTFARVFGKADWSLMFILAKHGQTTARLQFSAGPGGQLALPVMVDYSRSFAASDQAAWKQEYLNNVHASAMDRWDAELLADDRWWPETENDWLLRP